MAVTEPTAPLLPLHEQLPVRRYLAAMWARRDFVIAMPMEEVRSSHRNTLLGNIWHLANPMLSVAVYYLVFGVILDVSRGVDNYIVWLMVGMFAYQLTNKCVLGGATAISANQGLMRSIRFPRALLPVSVIIARLLTFGFELVVLGIVLVATGESITWRWLLLPIVVLLHSLFNLGGAFIAARLNDSFRDVQQIIPFLMRLFMYVSGVMIPLDMYLDAERHGSLLVTLVRLNPMVALLDLYRWMFMGTVMHGDELVRLIVMAVALLVAGFWFFRSNEHRYGRA